MTKPKRKPICDICGVKVVDMPLHKGWHEFIQMVAYQARSADMWSRPLGHQ